MTNYSDKTKRLACGWVLSTHPLLERDTPPTDAAWAAWFDAVIDGTAEEEDENGDRLYWLTEQYADWGEVFALQEVADIISHVERESC